MTKVAPDGTRLDYSGYIGGRFGDYASAIAVDGSGNAYVVGDTTSRPEHGFPVLVGPAPTVKGGREAFVTKIASTPVDLCDVDGDGDYDADDAGSFADQCSSDPPPAFQCDLDGNGAYTTLDLIIHVQSCIREGG